MRKIKKIVKNSKYTFPELSRDDLEREVLRLRREIEGYNKVLEKIVKHVDIYGSSTMLYHIKKFIKQK